MKWLSRKLLIALWAVAMTTYIVIANRSEFVLLAEILCAVPLMYMGVNVFTKTIDFDTKKAGKKND